MMATDIETRMLLIVQSLDRATVRDVARVAGRSISRTHAVLSHLRAKGLVDWLDGQQGTLHATVRPVPLGVPPTRRS